MSKLQLNEAVIKIAAATNKTKEEVALKILQNKPIWAQAPPPRGLENEENNQQKPNSY